MQGAVYIKEINSTQIMVYNKLVVNKYPPANPSSSKN